MGSLVINALLKYIEAHPDVIEKLIEAAINGLITHLDAQAEKAVKVNPDVS